MKNGLYEIKKNVPIPPRHRSSGFTKTLTSCKVGDSFLVPGSTRTNCYMLAYRQKMKVTIRHEGSNYRVWRTK